MVYHLILGVLLAYPGVAVFALNVAQGSSAMGITSFLSSKLCKGCTKYCNLFTPDIFTMRQFMWQDDMHSVMQLVKEGMAFMLS